MATTLAEAKAKFRSVKVLIGYIRYYMQCKSCGCVYFHECIPYGLGYGYSSKACMCVTVSRSQPTITLAEQHDDNTFITYKGRELNVRE